MKVAPLSRRDRLRQILADLRMPGALEALDAILRDVDGGTLTAPTGSSSGIGFAIPTSIAKSTLEEIIEHGRPVRGWLGIEAQAITPEIARAQGLKSNNSVVVTAVTRNGPAHKAGVQAGDVITAIDGKKIGEAREAMLAILTRRPGTRISLTVLRDGKELKLDAVASERPQQTQSRR